MKPCTRLAVLTTCVFLCVLPSLTVGQNSQIDSLREVLPSLHERDTMKVIALNTLSSLLVNTDPDQAARMAEAARKLAEKQRYKTGLAHALLAIGNSAYNKGDFDRAFENYTRSLEIFQRLRQQGRIALLWNELGGVHQIRRKFTLAEANHQRALRIYRSLRDTLGIARSLQDIGETYRERHVADTAIIYLRQSLELRENIRHLPGIAASLNELGGTYTMNGRYDEAMQCYTRSLAIRQEHGMIRAAAETLGRLGNLHYRRGEIDAALKCYKEALANMSEVGNRKGVAGMCNSLSGMFLVKGDVDASLDHATKALRLHTALRDTAGMAKALTNIGNVFLTRGDFGEARAYYARSVPLHQAGQNLVGMSKSLNNIGVIFFRIGDYDSALVYYTKVQRIRERLSDVLGLGWIHNNIGVIHARQGNNKRAMEHFANALRLGEQLRNQQMIAASRANTGDLHWKRGEHTQALECYMESLRSAEDAGAKEAVANCLQNIAMIQEDMGAFEAAMEYHRRARTLREQMGDLHGLVLSLQSIGHNLMSRDKLEEAETSYLRSLEIAEQIGLKDGVARAYGNLGQIQSARNDFRKAMEHYRQSLTIFSAMGAERDITETLAMMGRTCFFSGEYDQANAYCLEARHLAAKQGMSLVDVEYDLSRIASAQHRPHVALEHFRKYVALKDSIFKEDQLRILNETIAKYESEKKDQHIVLLERQQAMRDLQLEQQRSELLRRALESERDRQDLLLLTREHEIQHLELNQKETLLQLQQLRDEKNTSELTRWKQHGELKSLQLTQREHVIAGLAAGFALLLVIAFLMYRRIKGRQLEAALRAESAELQVRAAEAETHRLAAIHARKEHETQRKLTRRLIEAQERERQRVAVDLHDSLGQELVVIKTRALLAMKKREDVETLHRQLQEVVDMTTTAMESVRDIAYDLRPTELDRLGLTAAIRTVVHRTESALPKGIQTSIDAIDGLFPKNEEIFIYRIVQECIANIIRHAEASRARIAAHCSDGYVEIVVEDDGKGFTMDETQREEEISEIDMQNRKAGGGTGLRGIQERAAMLGGTAAIISARGEGTRLHVLVPIPEPLPTVPGIVED